MSDTIEEQMYDGAILSLDSRCWLHGYLNPIHNPSIIVNGFSMKEVILSVLSQYCYCTLYEAESKECNIHKIAREIENEFAVKMNLRQG